MIVVWRASPNFGSSARGVPGRLNVAIRAEVKHRIVGSLASARVVFADPNRQASTHFGIGTINGVLSIDQYVDLSDMAWGNGDVRDPTWSRYRAGENPNLSTVSTEHEDGGEANRGRISDATWRASMDLSRLLRSGDVLAIRAAGVRVRDAATVAQLAAMPIDTSSYIDHHQIAGPNKPYCLRRWLDDPGFVEGSPSRRDRLLTFLAEADVPILLKVVREKWTTRFSANGSAGYFTTDGPGQGTRKWFTAAETVESYAETADGKYRALSYNNGSETLWMERGQLTPIAGTRQPPTGFGLVTPDCSAQVKAAQDATALKAEAQVQAWIATRPPVVP